jgi:signal transduction histidine kinase
VSRPRPVWLAAVAAAAALGAEWMRTPGWILAAGLMLLGAVAAGAVWLEGHEVHGRGVRVAGAVLAAALALAACGFTWRLGRLRDDWPRVREQVVMRASSQLQDDLGAAFGDVRRLADRAATLIGWTGAPAFRRLEALVPEREPARGVVLFDALGRPAAWAGTLRVALSPAGPELSTVTTPFYLWLVARRQAHDGTAVAAVLLARASYAPTAGVALTDRFADRVGVGLHFYPPGGAPADSDVFDYVLPHQLAGGDTLFAVQPVPPEQDAAIADLLAAARRTGFWIVVALLFAGIVGAVRADLPVAGAGATAAAAALCVARAPLGEAFGADSVFSSATYYQDVLGPFSRSAGTVILTSFVVALIACALWRRGLKPGLPSKLGALGVTVLAPYLLQDLARGITPPAAGVTPALWLTWQIALVLSASALVLVAAALVRGPAAPAHAGARPFLAALLAIGLAVAGLFLWEPRGAWPEWYPYLWLPALLVAIRPMPFRSTIATVAVVAGSAAALLEWGTTTGSRIALATQDMEGLGNKPDPLKVALFDRLVRGTPPTVAPETAGDLYLLWRRTDFAAHNYPAALSLWSAQARRVLQLDLAQLDLPAELVQGQVQEALEERLPLVRSYLRREGVYGLATVPLMDGRVVAAAVGPQSSLVAPSRVARFLAGSEEEPEPPYRLTLSPLELGGPPPAARATWVRSGWTIRGERVVELPGGHRHVHAQVDLGGLSGLVQRGLLLLVLDFGVLAALWLIVDVVGGRFVPNVSRWFPRVHRSLRARLTVSLAAFFVLPTVAFALWSYSRQGDEFRRSRELLIGRTLQDAAAALEEGSLDKALALPEVAQRVDAELVLSRGGALQASSAPVLADLGLVDWLMPPGPFTRLAFGDYLEVTGTQEDTPQPVLVGYHLLQQAEMAILASPQLLSDQALSGREEDLGIAVLVAAVLGIVAALVLSGLAARALARPIRHLTEAALVAGAGERPTPLADAMPSELVPVYRAIEQAAADVERGHEAQRILAWGEMARQVAHEIKNPLTPIRLGIQHLLRLRRERPADLGGVLDGTGARILAEIDRLDAIARAFSRFALPTAERPAVEVVRGWDVAQEVVGLYQLGDTSIRWEIVGDEGLAVMARRDELAEVLVNLFENARDAGATRIVVRQQRGAGAGGPADVWVQIEVQDNGRGIPAAALPRVFEPRFSTTTSGSGLGLAIAKRLVEGWGGAIGIRSELGAGTTVSLGLVGPAPPAPA